ncbi:MAG: hypothetical protein O3B08_13205 [Proteobacteria bacterium]|nr:hypothetical protein [Pseudomonadota bacterium]
MVYILRCEQCKEPKWLNPILLWRTRSGIRTATGWKAKKRLQEENRKIFAPLEDARAEIILRAISGGSQLSPLLIR